MEGPVSLSESQKCKRKKNNTLSETAHPTPPRHRGGVLNTSACPSFPSLPCSSSKPWVSTNLAPAHLLPACPSHGSVLLAKNHPAKTHCARTRACQCHLHTRCSLPVTEALSQPRVLFSPFRNRKDLSKGSVLATAQLLVLLAGRVPTRAATTRHSVNVRSPYDLSRRNEEHTTFSKGAAL